MENPFLKAAGIAPKPQTPAQRQKALTQQVRTPSVVPQNPFQQSLIPPVTPRRITQYTPETTPTPEYDFYRVAYGAETMAERRKLMAQEAKARRADPASLENIMRRVDKRLGTKQGDEVREAAKSYAWLRSGGLNRGGMEKYVDEALERIEAEGLDSVLKAIAEGRAYRENVRAMPAEGADEVFAAPQRLVAKAYQSQDELNFVEQNGGLLQDQRAALQDGANAAPSNFGEQLQGAAYNAIGSPVIAPLMAAGSAIGDLAAGRPIRSNSPTNIGTRMILDNPNAGNDPAAFFAQEAGDVLQQSSRGYRANVGAVSEAPRETRVALQAVDFVAQLIPSFAGGGAGAAASLTKFEKLARAGARFAAYDAPGYGQMISQAGGNVPLATKRFIDSTVGQFQNAPKLLDPKVSPAEKVEISMAMMQGGMFVLAGISALPKRSKGMDQIVAANQKGRGDSQMIRDTAKFYMDQGVEKSVAIPYARAAANIRASMTEAAKVIESSPETVPASWLDGVDEIDGFMTAPKATKPATARAAKAKQEPPPEPTPAVDTPSPSPETAGGSFLETAKYKPDAKYNQNITEVTYLNPKQLKHTDVDGLTEVTSVSDEAARNMQFTEPVEATVFASGEIKISNGNHRLAAARQLGLDRIPVQLRARNASGKRIQELISESDSIGGAPLLKPAVWDNGKGPQPVNVIPDSFHEDSGVYRIQLENGSLDFVPKSEVTLKPTPTPAKAPKPVAEPAAVVDEIQKINDAYHKRVADIEASDKQGRLLKPKSQLLNSALNDRNRAIFDLEQSAKRKATQKDEPIRKWERTSDPMQKLPQGYKSVAIGKVDDRDIGLIASRNGEIRLFEYHKEGGFTGNSMDIAGVKVRRGKPIVQSSASGERQTAVYNLPAEAPAPTPKPESGSAGVRESQVKAILDASAEQTDSLSSIVPRKLVEGSDGKWYNPVGGVPRGKELTGKERTVWVAQSKRDGTTHGTQYSSEAEAMAARNERAANNRAKFEAELSKMSDADVAQQHDYWVDAPKRKQQELSEMAARADAAREAKQKQADAKTRAPLAKQAKKENVSSGQPWEQHDIERRTRIKEIEAKRTMSRGDEIRLAQSKRELAADPTKWKVGEGVGYYPVGFGKQVNRGFRITEINAATKEVKIRQFADTGLTTTGGNFDKIGDQWVHVADLVRDRKYDTPAPKRTAQTKAALKDAVAEYTSETQKLGARMSPEAEAKKMQAALKVVRAAIDHGIASVDEIITQTRQYIEAKGMQLTKTDEARMRKAYALATRSDEPEVGITHADLKTLKDELGFAPYSKSGKPLTETVANARSKGLVEKAENIAHEVNAKPRTLTDEETAAVGIRFSQSLDERTTNQTALGKAYDDGDMAMVAELEGQRLVINDRVNVLADALDRSGTEAGRSLKARQIVINKGYGKESLTYKARAAKKAKLTSAEIDYVNEQAQKIAALEKKLADQQKLMAEKVVRGGVENAPRAKGNKIFTEDRYAEILKRRQQANAAMKSKQRGGTTLNPQDFADLAFTIGYWTEKGIRSAPEIISKARELFPNATHEDIALAGRHMQETRRANKAPRPDTPTLGQMLSELDRLGGIAKEKNVPLSLEELKLKAKEIAKMPEGKDLEAMREWQIAVHKLAAKLNTGTSIGETVFTRGSWGVDDPELANIRYELRRAKQVADAWVEKLQKDRERAAMSQAAKFWSTAVDAMGLPRAIMASTDLSAVGRQGLILAVTKPKAAYKAFGKMRSALRSDENAARIMSAARDKYEATGMMEKMVDGELAITDSMNALLPREEDFTTSLTGWTIKVRGKEIRPLGVVKVSERAYTTFLNLIRMEAFDAMVTSMEHGGKPLTKAELKAVANYVNVASGRGSIGSLNNSPEVSRLFFAPRYWASRVQYLAGAPMYGGSKRTRLKIAGEYAKFIGFTGVALGLAAAAGWTEKDPRSTDFGKLKLGDRTYDLTGGLGTHLVFGTRVFAPVFGQQPVKSRDGMSDSVEWAAKSYGRSRLAPIPGVVLGATVFRDVKTGLPTNAIGQKQRPDQTLRTLIMPLGVSSAWEDFAKGEEPGGSQVAGFIANLFGFSSNSYKSN